MKDLIQKISQTLKIVFLALFLSFGISYVYAWSGPSAAPPDGNTATPLNTGPTNQTKTGGLLDVSQFWADSIGTDFGATFAILGGNVGVGTTTPSQPLSVGGIIYSGTGGFKFPDGTTQTTAAAGGVSQWTTSGSNIYYNVGNVGIGSTTPYQKLDIFGNVQASGTVGGSAGLCIGGVCRTSWPGRQRFTSSGNFTVPAGVTTVWVTMSGGGGGGGGGGGCSGEFCSGTLGGGGGGAGSVIAQALTVTPGTVYTITRGAGGAAGAAGAAGAGIPGIAGGSSSFGALLSVGGGGGGGNNATIATGGGASGGAGGSAGVGPYGGGSIFGTAGFYSTAAGPAGTGYGAGGAGGGAGSDLGPGVAGGAGAPGFILVEW